MTLVTQITISTGKDKGNGESLLFMGMLISIATTKISMEVFQETKNGTTMWSSYTTPWYLSKELRTAYFRDTFTPMFIAVWFTVAKLLQ